MGEDTDDAPRTYVRRKKTAYDIVIAAGSLAGALGLIGVGFTTITDRLPFEQKETHAADIREVKSIIDNGRVMLAQVRTDNEDTRAIIIGMQRDQWRTLQLQLEQKIDALTTAIESQPPNSQVRQQLQQARAEVRQQLSEINMKLQR